MRNKIVQENKVYIETNFDMPNSFNNTKTMNYLYTDNSRYY